MTAADLLHRSAAVLSDLDGTLLDSSASVHRTWGRFAQRHGLDPGAVVEFVYGRPVREAIPVLVPGADHDAELAAIEAAELTDTPASTPCREPAPSWAAAGRWPSSRRARSLSPPHGYGPPV